MFYKRVNKGIEESMKEDDLMIEVAELPKGFKVKIGNGIYIGTGSLKKGETNNPDDSPKNY